MPFIVIDAGHGGWDTGITGNGQQEKDVALRVATSLADRLQELGFKVKLLREGDVDMGSATKRGRAIARLHPDFALSFHVGSGGKAGSTIVVPLGKTCSKFESALHKSLEELRFSHRVCSKEARSQRTLNRSSAPGFRFAPAPEGPDYYSIMREAWKGGVPLDMIELFDLESEADSARFFQLEEAYVEAVAKGLAHAFDLPYDRSVRHQPAAYYRVVCGAYDSLEEARHVQNLLQKQFPNAWVQPVDPERR